jgi:GTP cyclohydrolase I
MKVINEKVKDLVETIDWVGMDSVKLPIQYKYQGHLYRTAAQLDIAVALDNPEFKGIDMAELYFNSQELLANQELNFINLKELTEKLLQAHDDRSEKARIEISFDAFKENATLRSNEKGLHAYPISLELVNVNGDFDTLINFEILYASTCPCSEAASRQENLEKFEEFFAKSKNPKKDFKDWYLNPQNSFAHPHAQKSKAAFSLVMAEYIENPVDFALETIAELEDLIQTAVHAAVRQEDEAAFTKKMGDNLIFIEDAAKKFKSYIKNKELIASSTVELTHYESLHPHNAKAFFTT